MSEQAADPVNLDARPRPSGRRAQVQARILDAAERIFVEEGAPGLSMRRLAEAVELSPAAIYKHFDSKGAVIEALRDAFFTVFLVRLEEAKAEIDDPIRALHIGLETYIRVALEKPHHYRAAFTLDAAHDADPDRSESYFPADSPRWLAFRHLLDQLGEVADALGERPEDVDAAARSVWASLHGLALLMIKLPHWPESGREPMISAHVATVLRGVFPKSA